MDKFNLRKVILEEYRQIEDGLKLGREVDLPEGLRFQSVMISGMGGSALPADVLNILVRDSLKNKGKREEVFEIYQNRTYELPAEAYRNSLNIICSYSGNTEETIASFREALDAELPCVALSNGGKIEEMSKEFGIPHIKIPYPFENFQPRMATGYFVFVIWGILEKIGAVNEFATGNLPENLKKFAEEKEVFGKELAEELVKKTPVVYSTDELRALAMIWKIKFNENSKTPAFWNYFPELNHNEMVGFTNPQADFHFIILRDKDTHPQNLKRMETLAELMREKNLESSVIDLTGETMAEKVFTTLCLGDWVSYYLALQYGIDPTPVDMVEEFKKRIA